jgi:ankyrin repeat protein
MNRDREAIQRYERAMSLLQSGSQRELEDLERELDGFPAGEDPFIERRWIINAIDVGSMESIGWMLTRAVDLCFRDEEGYTPVLSALERDQDDRLELLELLLQAGAPVNLKGVNDWTPAHMAAARDDVDALRILVSHGADLSIRTEIDEYATPLEEARNLGKLNAVRYLEGAVQQAID